MAITIATAAIGSRIAANTNDVFRRRESGNATQLEQRVDEGGDGARLRKHNQQSEQHEYDHDRNEPVLLFLLEKLKELAKHATFTHDQPLENVVGPRSCPRHKQ